MIALTQAFLKALLASDEYVSNRRSSGSSSDFRGWVFIHFLSLLVDTASGGFEVSSVDEAGCKNGKMPAGDAWLLDGTNLY